MAFNLGTLFFRVRADTKDIKKAEGVVKKSTGKMSKSFSRLGVAIGAALSFEVARRAQLIADQMLLLDIRLKAVSDTTAQFTRNQQALLKAANETGQAFADVVILFEKLKLASKDIGATNAQVLALTENLNKLGVIGGASATEINNSLRQLSQAFAGGIVRAEEFNSIVENTPAIARAIADGMELSVGQLRNMVIEGRLLAEDVFNAILSQQDKIDERFAKIPRTSSMAWQAVQNQAAQALKLISQELDSSKGISGAFDRLADNIDQFVKNVLIGIQGIRAGWQAAGVLIIATWDKIAFRVETFINNMKAGFKSAPLVLELGLLKAIENLPGFGDKIKAQIAEVEQNIRDIIRTEGALSDEQHQRKLDQIEERKQAELAAIQAELEADIIRINSAEAAKREARETGGDAGADTGDVGAVGGSKELDEAAFQDTLARFGDETAIILSAERKRQEEISKIVGLGIEERAILEKRSAMLLQRDMARITMMRIASVQGAVDSIVNLITEGNAKQSALGRAAIAVSKGLAIAQAAIALQQNIAEASKIGFPANIPFIAGAIAQGAGILSALNSIPTAPGRVNGGPAVGGFATPVTEDGRPELFEQNGRKFIIPGAGGGGMVSPMGDAGGGGIKVNIINNGEPVDAQVDMVSRSELNIILEKQSRDTINAIDTSLSTAQGSTFDALRRSVDLNRNVR